MSKPRTTMTISQDGKFFELYLNPAARDHLVRELQALDESDDHLHLDPEGFGEVTMSVIPYRDDESVVAYGKISLRPDQWDLEHSPHVMTAATDEP